MQVMGLPPPLDALRGHRDVGGFSKIRGTFLGVPITTIIVFEDLYWASPCFGTLQSKQKSQILEFTGLPSEAYSGIRKPKKRGEN